MNLDATTKQSYVTIPALLPLNSLFLPMLMVSWTECAASVCMCVSLTWFSRFLTVSMTAYLSGEDGFPSNLPVCK